MNNKLRQKKTQADEKKFFSLKRQKLKNTSEHNDRPRNIKNIKHKWKRKITLLSSLPPLYLTFQTLKLLNRRFPLPLLMKSIRVCLNEITLKTIIKH